MIGKVAIGAASFGLVLPTMMCGMPGMSLDLSNLGDTPIGEQVEHMISFDDEYAERFSSEWFAKRCPAESVEAITACAMALGLTCGGMSASDSSQILCTYQSQYRTRRVTYSVSPSVDGKPASPWNVVDVFVQLERSSEGRVRLVFDRQGDATLCGGMPTHPFCD
jgi:hypothetical protein